MNSKNIFEDEFELRLLLSSVTVEDIPLLKFVKSIDVKKQRINFNRDSKIWYAVFPPRQFLTWRGGRYSVKIKSYRANDYRYISISSYSPNTVLKVFEKCAKLIKQLGGSKCLS